MKVISSRTNGLVRSMRRLRDSARERRRRNATLLDGIHLVAEYVARVGAPRAVLVTAGAVANAEIAALLTRIPQVRPVLLTDPLFKELSTVATPSGILAEVPVPAVRAATPDMAWCMLVEDVQDPGNLGSMLRSAAAAGMDGVLLSRGCADAWSPRVLRAAMGAHFALNLQTDADLVGFARGYRGQVVATSPRAGTPIFDVNLTGPTALAVGNEGAGLSITLLGEADVVVMIPVPGAVESLNVAAAAAVCVFERVRQTAMRRNQ